MKTEQQIKDKLKQIKYRYLKKIIRQHRKTIPANCTHNKTIISDTDANLTIGVCNHPINDDWLKVYSEDSSRVCDLNFGGQEKCKSCPLYSWGVEKSDIKTNFDEELISLTAAELAYNYPELMTLFWVLDTDEEESPLIIEDEDLGPAMDKILATIEESKTVQPDILSILDIVQTTPLQDQESIVSPIIEIPENIVIIIPSISPVNFSLYPTIPISIIFGIIVFLSIILIPLYL